LAVQAVNCIPLRLISLANIRGIGTLERNQIDQLRRTVKELENAISLIDALIMNKRGKNGMSNVLINFSLFKNRLRKLVESINRAIDKWDILADLPDPPVGKVVV